MVSSGGSSEILAVVEMLAEMIGEIECGIVEQGQPIRSKHLKREQKEKKAQD